MNSEITIEFNKPISDEELTRIEENLLSMIAQGVFTVRNGRAILHFDNEGKLQIIAFDFIKWRRAKNSSLRRRS